MRVKKFLAGALLAGLLLAGGGLLWADREAAGCPGGCCTGPHDCPTPTCCTKK